jgi:hypothetical protein
LVCIVGGCGENTGAKLRPTPPRIDRRPSYLLLLNREGFEFFLNVLLDALKVLNIVPASK